LSGIGLYKTSKHKVARLPVGKIDRREKSLCSMHGSSVLGASDRTVRSTIAPNGMKAFHDGLASISSQHQRHCTAYTCDPDHSLSGRATAALRREAATAEHPRHLVVAGRSD